MVRPIHNLTATRGYKFCMGIRYIFAQLKGDLFNSKINFDVRKETKLGSEDDCI